MRAVLIPSYKPPIVLVQLTKHLSLMKDVHVFIVNDGSPEIYDSVFNDLKSINNVTVISHAINLGKGAALKSGFNYIYVNYPMITSVITADADGQHSIEDIQKVMDASGKDDELIIGVRKFIKGVPLRSRLGNIVTKYLFKILIGYSLSDTQSGLRAIPRKIIPKLLRIQSDRYEFELDMLIKCKQLKLKIREIPISTIYIENNKSSHFNPLWDSLRIYIVLFRFSICSLLTVLVDYSTFYMLHAFGAELALCLFGSRALALCINYPLVKNQVFHSAGNSMKLFPIYLCLVIVAGLCSYGLMSLMISKLGLPIMLSKIIAEIIIYLGNFTFQRDFIFLRGQQNEASFN